MTDDLRYALRAEYELAHEAIRPDGVAAVHATASRNRRRRAFAGAAVLAVALAGGGAAAWRLAPGDAPPQMVGGGGCDRPGVDVSVFLREGRTDEQTAEIDRALRASPEVYCLVFETKEVAWERFKRDFSDAPDLVAATKVDQLPESFRFRVAKRAEVDVVEHRVGGLNGITDYICQCPTKSARR
ncbi:permease-like cell division protein FtsX [Dactylosporangium siamense]|uniref:FtsX extracellular domain-containing protein n=1 Tax=Dactylosporangium siamense TaxID=685454 RepID=A0A919UF96_9ACTN|nr:permease-like cell division protein FtsX [Dactylosporangium siamense]GIG49420.1 hypothetical protein Dsi01nite_074610 [Dactylosporangium siamense]